MKFFFIYIRLIFFLFFICCNSLLVAQFTQLGFNLNGSTDRDEYGTAVSLSSDGKTIAAGAYQNAGNNKGYVRVYQWNGFMWVPKGNDILGERQGDHAGYSIDISSDGNIVAIGAQGNSDNGSTAGHVRIFEWDGTNWNQKGNDIDGIDNLDRFGWAVCLSSDGNIIAVGAPGVDIWRGHVRIFGSLTIFAKSRICTQKL
jgi:hypothetical protein